MRIETIDDPGAFFRMREEWDALLAASRQDSPFLAHGWLAAWWKAFGSGRLNIVACRDGDGRLLGVAPTFVTSKGRLARARVARFLGDESVGSEGLTPFAHPDAETEVFDRLASHLLASDGWDMLELRFVDPEDSFSRRVSAAPRSRVYEDCGGCPRMQLPEDWDSYMASLPKRKRSHFGRNLRRAEEAGARLEIISEAEQLPLAIADLFALHEARMRARHDPEYAVSAAYRLFTGRTIEQQLAEGRLRLFFIRIDGERHAVRYMFRYGDTMYGVQSGFDDDERAANALRPLMLHCIRRAIEEGCTAFDHGLGEQHYKEEWGETNVLRLARLTVYGDSPAAHVRRNRDGLEDWLKRSRASGA